MINIRPADERGFFDHGWLQTYHTFSFGEYYDPDHMSFRNLRVINEDVVAPGQGFPTHPHKDMEIITYVLEGQLAHKDSTGGSGVIVPGEVQYMSAGSGVRHSEFNASATDPVHLLQIWITPNQKDLQPGYDQKPLPVTPGELKLIASPDGRGDTLQICQDVELYAAKLNANGTIEFDLPPERHAWLQVARGAVELNGVKLDAGAGAAISQENHLNIKADKDAEFLLFNLA
jgi:quercetin 2,3-dioxygenase